MNSLYTRLRPLAPNHPVFLCQNEQGELAVEKHIDLHAVPVYAKLRSHPIAGIPRILDIEVLPDHAAIYTQYVPGPTLKEVQSRHPLSKKEIRNVMSSLCSIVHALHKRNIVHRDIKPENIVMNADQVYLIDFDISRQYVPGQNKDTRLMGTPGYASPEQFGFAQSGMQSDIYSLGKVLETLDKNNDFSPLVKKACALETKNRFRNAKHLNKAILGIPYIIPGWNNPSRWARIVCLVWTTFSLIMVRDFGVNDIDLHFGIYAAVLILSLLLVPMWALSNLDNFCAWPKGKHWLVRLLYAAAIGFLVFLLIAMAAVLLDEITDQIVKSML